MYTNHRTKLMISPIMIIWVKVIKNEPSKIYGRQPLKNFTWSILEYLDPFVKGHFSFIPFLDLRTLRESWRYGGM